MGMKKIEATVRPIAFSAVRQALQALGIGVITVSRAETIGRHNGADESSSGRADSQSKSTVEIAVVVEDAIAARARDAIVGATRGETLCVGKILISHIDQAIDLSADDPVRDAAERDVRAPVAI
jgi:nitrogen regulatory protein PII